MQDVANGEAREDLLKQLCERIESCLEESKAKQVVAFANDFYHSVPVEDLSERDPEELYGATLSLWQFLQQFDESEAKVRVINPDFENHGWQSAHTYIAVLNKDMPFLVDSVRVELNRRGMTVHAIHNTVIQVERDAKHHLVRLLAANESSSQSVGESLIAIEVDRRTDTSELDDIESSIADVLVDVRTSVNDFAPMLSKVQSAVDELKSLCPAQIDKQDHQEAIDFLEWLQEDNFTFLGYDEYSVTASGKQLAKVEGSELGVFRLDQPRYREWVRANQGTDSEQVALAPKLVSFAKSAHRARVHRPAYPDYISIDRYDDQGRITGEYRFMGLFTSTVYNDSPRHVPILRRKIDRVMSSTGFDPAGHNGKRLLQTLEVYPRDDLFQVDEGELAAMALSILDLRERRRVRLFIREDTFGKYYSCLVFVPRDVFSTELRLRLQDVLCNELDATFGDFNTYLSESVLARIQFILRFNGDAPVEYEIKRLEKQMAKLARNWRDDLLNAAVESFGEERANQLMNRFRDAFPSSYQEDFSARTAVYDLQHISELSDQQPLALSLYRQIEAEGSGVNLKLFHRDQRIPLSDVLPMMENLGLRVLGERPYEVVASGTTHWIHDFDLEHHASSSEVNLQEMREPFIEAFQRIWAGEADNDAFNRLIIGANLGWREVAMLRTYARYLKQIGLGMSQSYIATTLSNYPHITRELVTLFALRFNPVERPDDGELAACEAHIMALLDDVPSLNDDQMLRRYMELINATLRTNYYQHDEHGGVKDYIAIKLEPAKVSGMPKPLPAYEIFVCSPRVEGVHLRGGKVARGGLRWSDRHEDFRTEVLGLVKAQQVKNAVIVPVGAKGGFVCKRMPEGADRDTTQKEGIACYQIFIRALLDVTDNLDGETVVVPREVVRHDGDDAYLVVAADKGTATFSNIANAISAEYGHWLGDAFASGGEHGYDHKGMGITATGAWESVKRHFRGLGINTQQDAFSVVGIGDMAGDVFGNGMLRSEHIRLVGAFNHMHIFIDPTPDAASTFAERKRLFETPRTTWEDFNTELISKGGGVFLRSAKTIAISPEMKKVFGITQSQLPPNELIRAMLKSSVDLIWNGGIGTYIKGSVETDADVGDKANDVLRINGRDVNARVIGEGGNLGMTQLGRMEAAAKGVRVNTDFIDNAGGVNCSDHEVNIKILIDDIVARGDMTEKQRNQLLEDMTDEVSELVLAGSYRQTQALDLAELASFKELNMFRRFISELEAAGLVDRELEFLPSDEELQERAHKGQGMLLPELSVLLSYAKSSLKNELVVSDVPDDPVVRAYVEGAFPKVLAERYHDEMYQHRLVREIVATQLANDLVEHMGIVFVRRLLDSTGYGRAEIARAYVIAAQSFNLLSLWGQIEALDNQVPSAVQYSMMLDLIRMMRRSTRWFLRQHSAMSTSEAIDYFKPRLTELQGSIGNRLRGEDAERWQQRRDELIKAGVPEALASTVAASTSLYAALGIINVASQSGDKPQRVAEVFYEVGDRLELPWMIQQVTQLEVGDNWQAQARESFRDDIERQQLSLTAAVLDMQGGPKEAAERTQAWLTQHEVMHERWCRLLEKVRGTQADFPLFAVAVRELVDLSESNRA
ncbi:NAD-glutamate dehydrogenase [Halomonas halocynthiae]|uniref:NAD-glutamate dehydrogenase n=1 Tax=Halomonas halocynthiae TaxID=176290 RepID=UPI000409B75A|nr:NAD-glutamate dehydrogenase [Halomonas halocynthiae]